MKKITMLTMLTFSVFIGGCAQSTQDKDSAASTTEAKQVKSDFPKKPIEMIVPYAPGSSTEMIARIVAKAAESHLPNKQSIVIVNKPGGAGTIGTTEVFRANPDGYKIGMITVNQVSIQPHLGKTLYSHDGFQPIMKATNVPQLLAVKADAPWKTFDEWMDYVKKNPGKFTYATPGAGATTHISLEAINAAAGVQTKAVHFESGGQQLNAVLGGHVQGASVPPQQVKEYIKSGDLRILANLGSYKPEAYKDVPLLKEKGVDAAVDIYTGVIAPKGLPKEELDILHTAFKKAIEDPAVQEQLKKLDVDPYYSGPEDFQKEITESYTKYGGILKNIGLVK
jgi:tripartite-type tricarboxylate transporter receptor subunit TctC